MPGGLGLAPGMAGGPLGQPAEKKSESEERRVSFLMIPQKSKAMMKLNNMFMKMIGLNSIGVSYMLL